MNLADIPPEGLRLNLGCGQHTVAGWYCVDAVRHPKADRDPDHLGDLRKLPLPDECASELHAIHVWEHFYRWECDEVMMEWRRVLRPGAKIALEMPDLMKVCRNVLKGFTNNLNDPNSRDQLGLWGLYGDPRVAEPYMVHKWGWTYNDGPANARIKPFLERFGFAHVVEEETQWHPAGRGTRDFRVTARRMA